MTTTDNQITGEQIVAEARTWLGTPFHHRAIIKGVGVDCAHFLIGVFSSLGLLKMFEPDDYPPDWHLHNSEEKFLEYLKSRAVRITDPQPGDVVMFKFGRCASHSAIVIEWPRIIHSYVKQGVVYANADESDLRGRVHSFWRIKGDE